MCVAFQSNRNKADNTFLKRVANHNAKQSKLSHVILQENNQSPVASLGGCLVFYHSKTISEILTSSNYRHGLKKTAGPPSYSM